ncbi:MAG: site-2 protease family protein [Candidatus Thermoplasmatota archaeon]|jgi:membrane-associated protease RseP (regulator of RpoE activity)|nr:site-2 protease family protein [Candidatus Thermoplasmatota archaeon]
MEAQNNTVRVQSEDLEYLVNTVKSKIQTYEIQVSPTDVKFFYFNSDNPAISESFDEIRQELIPKGYIPFLYEGGEHYLQVNRRPPTKFRGIYVNIIMLILTLASTIYVGSLYAENYVSGNNPELMRLLYGFVFFSVPLMSILGIHELGHYIVAKRFKVRASLPFFIPFPFSIGTFGAFISLRDPVPNRKAMTEIGIAGPLFGFLLAFPLLFVADYLQKIIPYVHNYSLGFGINFPLVYHLLNIHPVTTPLFPMVFAVWVGMFATAMNLLPVGQLDGGHVVRGLLGRHANIVDYIFVALLFGLGFLYEGWWLLAIFVLILGLTHPPALDDYSRIPSRDIVLGIIALVMFVITFTPIPLVVK